MGAGASAGAGSGPSAGVGRSFTSAFAAAVHQHQSKNPRVPPPQPTHTHTDNLVGSRSHNGTLAARCVVVDPWHSLIAHRRCLPFSRLRAVVAAALSSSQNPLALFASLNDFLKHPNPPAPQPAATIGGLAHEAVTGGRGVAPWFATSAFAGGSSSGKGRDGSPGRVHTRDASPPGGRGGATHDKDKGKALAAEGGRRDKARSPQRMTALEAAAAAAENNPLSISGNVGGRLSPSPPLGAPGAVAPGGAPGEKIGARK